MAVGNAGVASPVRHVSHCRAGRSRGRSRLEKIGNGVIGAAFTALLTTLARDVWDGINEQTRKPKALDMSDPYTSCVESFKIKGFFPPDPYNVYGNAIMKACGSGEVKWQNASVKVSDFVRTTCRPLPKENG